MLLKKRFLPMVIAATIGSNLCNADVDLIAVPGLPEDIVDVANSPWLIVSVMTPRGEGRDGLYALQVENNAVKPLSITPDANYQERFPDCPGAPTKLSPHGLALRETSIITELLAVNHGSREAIEVFELESNEGITLRWVGCVPLPNDVHANGVTPLPYGGLAVTSIFDPSTPAAEAAMLRGEVSGRVVVWHPDVGWQSLPGTEIPAANGLLANKQGDQLFVASWTAKQVLRFISVDGVWESIAVDLPFLPDNLRWHEGKILVTGQYSKPAAVVRCANTGEGCSSGLAIVTLDPSTLGEKLAFISSSDRLGEATVVVQKRGYYYVGNLRQSAVIRFPVE